MASDSEPKGVSAGEPPLSVPGAVTPASDRPKKKKLKRSRPAIPQTEDALDSPTKQTLGMLGILGIMTIVMWALARGGCNYHPPKETRVPRKVTTEELAHDPKNAAVELQQRLLTHNYTGALELATGNAALAVQQARAACDAACMGKRKALEQSVVTSAVVLDANPFGAVARVTSTGVPGGPTANLMRLSRVDALWKASDFKADTGAPAAASAAPSSVPSAPASGAPAPASPH